MLCSGIASVINQIIWQRALQIFVSGGEAISAMTIVVVFLLGLGGGSMGAAVFAPRIRRPLFALAIVELLLSTINIGVIGLLGHDWSWSAPRLYGLAVQTGLALPLVYASASAVVLTVPCFLMGTTVAFASEGAQRQLGVTESRFVTIVIVLNTIGAMFGALLAGFVLLPVYGQRNGLLAAVACNLAASALAFIICRARTPTAGDWKQIATPSLNSISLTPRYEDWIGMGLGVFALSFEMYLLRLAIQEFAALPYTFAAVLCAYLASWSVGVLISRRLRAPLFSILLLSAISVWAVMIGLSGHSLLEYAARGSLPCVAFGMAFGELASRVSDSWGNDVGRFYGWNTIGSCLGVVGTVLIGYEYAPQWTALFLIAGYSLLTIIEVSVHRTAFLGTFKFPIATILLLVGCWSFSGSVYFLAAIIILASAMMLSVVSGEDRSLSFHQIVVAMAVVLLTQLFFEKLITVLVGTAVLFWLQRHRILTDRGPSRLVTQICMGLMGLMLVTLLIWSLPMLNSLRPKKGKYFGRQGILEVKPQGLYWDGLWHSQFSDGQNHIGTKNWLMAANPLVAHPAAENLDTLVIGLASGITARTLAISDRVRRVDAYEINAKLSKLFEDYPEGCLNVATNPKVQIYYEDGRTGLAIRKKQYDLITQAPLYLKQAGSSALLSVEYMRLVKRRLRDDGIFCVYCRGTDAQAKVVRRTAKEVFPYTESCGNGYMILASGQPIVFDAERIDAFAAGSADQFDRELQQYGTDTLAMQLDRPRLASGVSQILVTDDHPIVEYPEILERLTSPQPVQ